MNSSPLTLLLFASGLPGEGYDFDVQAPAERALMLHELRALPGIAVTEQPMVTMIEDPAASTIWLVTREGHFAHPSVLERALVERLEGRAVRTSGHTAADPAIMAAWIGQFRTQDEQTRGSALA